MKIETLNLALQAGTLIAGALVTLYPPRNLWWKGGALAVIVLCGVGGLIAARQATVQADAQAAKARAEIVRLTRENDARVARVQDRLEDVSRRLAAKGIADGEPQEGASASTALDVSPRP